MSDNQFRVGVIGADTQASWAGASHIPALRPQPSLVLAAVATRREKSAKAAAEAFGAERWFADPYAMIRDDDIDLVTVAVKVPDHRDLVMAALAAGKSVYCESLSERRWPRPRRWRPPRDRCIPRSACKDGTILRSGGRPSWLRPARSVG